MDNYIAMKAVDMSKFNKLKEDILIPEEDYEVIAYTNMLGRGFTLAEDTIQSLNKPLVIIGVAIGVVKSSQLIDLFKSREDCKELMLNAKLGVLYNEGIHPYTFVIVRKRYDSIRELEKSEDT